MKFLVLALCVCAASAASVGYFEKQSYQPQQVKSQVSFTPSNTVVSVPAVTANTAYAAAQVVREAPGFAAKTVYGANEAAYDAGKDAESVVLRYDSKVEPDNFNYSFENSNGIAAQASGAIKENGEEKTLVVQGFYKYLGNDGKTYQLTYVADENGFQPQADYLPVGPEIPAEIVKSLEYQRAVQAKSETKY